MGYQAQEPSDYRANGLYDYRIIWTD